ncbi:hypothetical protein AB4254_09290 [Vibrio breoganii]
MTPKNLGIPLTLLLLSSSYTIPVGAQESSTLSGHNRHLPKTTITTENGETHFSISTNNVYKAVVLPRMNIEKSSELLHLAYESKSIEREIEEGGGCLSEQLDIKVGTLTSGRSYSDIWVQCHDDRTGVRMYMNDQRGIYTVFMLVSTEDIITWAEDIHQKMIH